MVERSVCIRKAQGSIPCSSILHPDALVAQWIEHQTSNLGVAGSSPAVGKFFDSRDIN